MPTGAFVAITIAILVVGGFFLARRADVRLVLMLSAAAFYAVKAARPESAGHRADAFAAVFLEFVKGLTNPQFVVPICTAMGFAYVCKYTNCDAHLVHLLLRPINRVRAVLIPGGIVVGFFVNSAIVSQTSTVSVVGPVLIPLLLAAGVSRQTAGALLLLGGSMGGELLNPAAVENAAIRSVTGQDSLAVVRDILPWNALACGVSLAVFWALARRYPDGGDAAAADAAASSHAPGSIAATMSAAEAAPVDRIDPFKALVPLIPILLLVFVRRVVVLPAPLSGGAGNPLGEQATIATAMLLGVVAAAAAAPASVPRIMGAFFEGAAFAFGHVISVIAAAVMFAQSIEANGLIQRLTDGLRGSPGVVTAAAVVLPWAFASITGTAVGTAPAAIRVLLPIALGVDIAAGAGATTAPAVAHIGHGSHVGPVAAIAAQFGRTTSPVAPVVIMCATLSRQRPLALVRRVLPPLLAGGAVLLVAAWARGH